ncbi:MAG TPA: hypothetical protein DIW77_16650 [Chromatiaceae bacterium]|nr:hypothetical protein [Chromatiaceae bacterium]
MPTTTCTVSTTWERSAAWVEEWLAGRCRPLPIGNIARPASLSPTRRLTIRLTIRWCAILMLSVCLSVTSAVYASNEPDVGKAADHADTLRDRITRIEASNTALQQQRQRLSNENRELKQRLQQSDLFAELSQQIDAQMALLERLAAALDLNSTANIESSGQSADDALIDENARLQAELTASNRRLRLLTEQFAIAHRLRLDALAEAAAARENSAELNARLRQRQQAADEALMRADKAEKLHAALEQENVRISTENERLSRDLETARERQAEAMRRIIDLDRQLADARAGAMPATISGDGASATLKTTASEQQHVQTDVVNADASGHVIYRVRADDTLSSISKKVYGNTSAWTRIFEANRDRLETPDDLALGMPLIIP